MKKITITVKEEDYFDPQKITITINNPVRNNWLYDTYYDLNGYNDPCYYCGNNPKNNPNASGFCNCSLPSKNITY